MGRNDNKCTLGDFIMKRGLKKRRGKFRWKNRDAQRKRGSPALSKRKGRKALKKNRALQQIMVAHEVEEYDRQQEAASNAHCIAEIKGQEVSGNGEAATHQAETHVDESTFRAHVLDCIMDTLFPATTKNLFGARDQTDAMAAMDQSFEQQQQLDAPIVLDELDRRSMCRIVRDAIFWQARREPFSFAQLYWFVPDEKLAQCFVTPRVVAILLEETVAAKEPLERELRVMALRMIHSKLCWLEHSVLRSLYEWSAAHLQRTKQFLRKAGPAPAREALQEGTCGHGHGLVKLWATLVDRYAATAAVAAPEGHAAAGGDAGPSPTAAIFADPFVLLSRILGTFIRAPQILSLHSELVLPATETLVGARPALGPGLLQLLLLHWPRQDSAKELACVRLLGVCLGALSPEDAFGQVATDRASISSHIRDRILTALCKRWSLLLQSPQAQVAQEAMKIIDTSMFIFMRYIVSIPKMADAVSEALHAAQSHWNEKVRDYAEKMFDRMLDYK